MAEPTITSFVALASTVCALILGVGGTVFAFGRKEGRRDSKIEEHDDFIREAKRRLDYIPELKVELAKISVGLGILVKVVEEQGRDIKKLIRKPSEE